MTILSNLSPSQQAELSAAVSASDGDTVARGLAAQSKTILGERFFTVRGAVPGVDQWSRIMDQIANARAKGGVVFLPRIGGSGYTISDTLIFDYDDAQFAVQDAITCIKTNPAALVGPDAPYSTGVNGTGLCAVLFAGRLKGPGTKNYIKRPVLIGLGKQRISTIADQVSFTYVVGASGNHSPVSFSGTEDAYLSNIYAYNGLVGGISVAWSPNALVDNCVAELTQYDNGIQFVGNREHLAAFNPDDPRTWANVTSRDCVALRCRNHGIGSYGSVGVTHQNPNVYLCGNNTPRVDANGAITDAGPAGGINAEFDTLVGSSADHHIHIINPRVYGSYGFGIRSNCAGTQIVNGEVVNTKRPTAYSTDPSYPLWGSAVFAQGYGTVDCDGLRIKGSEAYGLRLSAASGGYPSISFEGGEISKCAVNAVYGTGIGRLSLSPTTLIKENGSPTITTPGTQPCVVLSNGAENTDGGFAQIAGRFEDNYGSISSTSRIAYGDYSKGLSGRNNGRAWSGPGIMIGGDKFLELHAANINLFSNGKAARIAQILQATLASIDRQSIIGDYTNTNFPAFELQNVTGTYYGNGPTNQAFPSFTPSFTPNSTNGNPTFGSPFITANVTINADAPSILPVSGQLITFTLIQDSTGGRTVTWNAAWKGATLTAAGTAGQRAQVTFRYSGQWAQVSNTGWYTP